MRRSLSNTPTAYIVDVDAFPDVWNLELHDSASVAVKVPTTLFQGFLNLTNNVCVILAHVIQDDFWVIRETLLTTLLTV